MGVIDRVLTLADRTVSYCRAVSSGHALSVVQPLGGIVMRKFVILGALVALLTCSWVSSAEAG